MMKLLRKSNDNSKLYHLPDADGKPLCRNWAVMYSLEWSVVDTDEVVDSLICSNCRHVRDIANATSHKKLTRRQQRVLEKLRKWDAGLAERVEDRWRHDG